MYLSSSRRPSNSFEAPKNARADQSMGLHLDFQNVAEPSEDLRRVSL
jgi:hypothetical protein